MKDTRLQIEIALLAGQVAKYALEFTDPVQDGLLLKLRFKQLVNGVNKLRESVLKATTDKVESQ